MYQSLTATFCDFFFSEIEESQFRSIHKLTEFFINLVQSGLILDGASQLQ